MAREKWGREKAIQGEREKIFLQFSCATRLADSMAPNRMLSTHRFRLCNTAKGVVAGWTAEQSHFLLAPPPPPSFFLRETHDGR
jgi:hypothetical protein